jgi:hypothetical protein
MMILLLLLLINVNTIIIYKGKPNARLGISAMAFTTPNIEKDELTSLSSKMREVALLAGTENMIGREGFEESCKSISKFEDPDNELLNNMFTMFDIDGENQIIYKEFAAGIGGCFITGTLIDKLNFAFTLYDNEETDEFTKSDIKKILNALNNVASYCGDPVVSSDKIEIVAQETFANVDGQVTNKDAAIQFISNHQETMLFCAGKGSTRFVRT